MDVSMNRWGDWLRITWNGRLRVLLRKRGMLVLDVFKGNLTLDVRSMIYAENADLVVIPGGMK
jgi:hypothetical protein